MQMFQLLQVQRDSKLCGKAWRHSSGLQMLTMANQMLVLENQVNHLILDNVHPMEDRIHLMDGRIHPTADSILLMVE